MEHMIDLMGRLGQQRAAAADGDATETSAPAAEKAEIRLAGPAAPVAEPEPEVVKIVPRRVRPAVAGRRERPSGMGLRQSQ